jgi:hypothetical protein
MTPERFALFPAFPSSAVAATARNAPQYRSPVCGAEKPGYIEISTNDAQTGDRYCGAFLAVAATADEGNAGNSAKRSGVIYAAESNPWSFGVYGLSNQAQNKISGFSITAQQTPCGLAASSEHKEANAT